MIDSKKYPAGSFVRLLDPKPEYALTKGKLYQIEYWDGSAVHVTDDDGCGCTLYAGRFEVTS